MKLKILGLLIANLIIVSCQDIESLVNDIAKKNTVECRYIGIIGSSSSVYKKFEKLKTICSKEQLFDLTNHDSLAVATYATYALLDRKLVSPSKVFANSLNKDLSVTTLCGCIVGEQQYSSLIYHRYRESRVDYSNENHELKLIEDSEDLRKMDSLILYKRSDDRFLLSYAFENRIYNNDYNSKILKLAFEDESFYALQYVFNNLRNGKEGKLIISLNNHLSKDYVFGLQKDKAKRMLMELEL